MQDVFFASQLAFLAMGIACGGPSTKAGGAFLLLSLLFLGAGIGWLAYGKLDNEGGE